ncbi:MAG TPA: hypothetical protein DCW42_09040 [Bacteroidetes bacterium]|nr:hypothetical protein [Bacteroidota bacterium]
MKICYIASLFEPELGGGAAKVVYDLAHGMANLGHEISVITSSSKKDQKTYIDNNICIYQIFAPNLYWIYDKDNQPNIKKFFFQLIDIWNPFVKRKIKKILLLESPDVVHVHKLRGLSPAVWAAADEVRVRKIIHTCHDYELISPQGALVGKIGDLSLRRKFPINFYQKIRAHFSKMVTDGLAPSKYLLEKHMEYGFFMRANQNIIPNTHGYTLSQIKEHKSLNNSIKTGLNILFIGRLVKEKGVEIICDVVIKLNKQGKEIHLDIIGNGRIELELKKKFSQTTRIDFHSAIHGQTKNDYLKKCDLLIFPSTWPESFGIVITEAFAFGKPVIASNIGAIPELIEDGYNGFLFEPNDKEQLENIITKIFNDKSLLDDMRENCFQSSENYCMETFIENHLEIYNAKN